MCSAVHLHRSIVGSRKRRRTRGLLKHYFPFSLLPNFSFLPPVTFLSFYLAFLMFSYQFPFPFPSTVDYRNERFPTDVIEPELSTIHPESGTF